MKITRMRVLVAVLALIGVFVVTTQSHSAVHAATGGTTVQFSIDPTLTTTASAVTSSQAFPDGNTTAACFIQATAHSGVQTTTYGACSGYSLNITCGSGEFTGVPPSKGAALTINGTAVWKGVYDVGTTCTTAPKVGGTNPTLTATVAGLTAGQNLVVFVNTDAGNGFNAPNGRNGCWKYNDNSADSTEQCFTTPYTTGPAGTFYEATAGAATGTIVQSLGAQLNNNGNETLGGIFIETVGEQAAPTSTPGGPTNTPAPTATPAPTNTPVPAVTAPSIGSAINQFGKDITIAAGSSGVTSSQPFPDGGTGANCFVKINSKSGVQSGTTGTCSAYTVTVTCSSFQFSSTPASDQHGAGAIIGGADTLSGGYDTGPNCKTIPGATLSYDVSGITAGTRLVFWWNNDSGPTRNGCVTYQDSTGHSTPACFVNNAAGNNGTFYEVIAGGTTGTSYEIQGGTNEVGSSGNVTAGGVFIGGTGTTPLSASLVTVHRSNRVAHVRWYSSQAVRGFNVFNGKTRLNHHLVTSRTGWYRFSTRHSVYHLRIVAVAQS